MPQDIVSKINMSIESVDEKNIEEWYKDRVYDREFQIAVFYSYLSVALAEKAAINNKGYEDYVKRDFAFKKSVDFWNVVVKKDVDLAVFRDYFIKKYLEAVKLINK